MLWLIPHLLSSASLPAFTRCTTLAMKGGVSPALRLPAAPVPHNASSAGREGRTIQAGMTSRTMAANSLLASAEAPRAAATQTLAAGCSSLTAMAARHPAQTRTCSTLPLLCGEQRACCCDVGAKFLPHAMASGHPRSLNRGATAPKLRLISSPRSTSGRSPRLLGTPKLKRSASANAVTSGQLPIRPLTSPLASSTPRRAASPTRVEVEPVAAAVLSDAQASAAQMRRATVVLRESTKTYIVGADFTAVLPQELTVRAGERVRVAGASHAAPRNIAFNTPLLLSQSLTLTRTLLGGSWCMLLQSPTRLC